MPPSGSAFTIGDTTVLCSAMDEAGNTNSCSFSVHVRTASEQLSDAGLVILGLEINPRIKKSILKKFQRIERQISADHTRKACRQVHGLLRQVERFLRRDRLTNDQAIQITTPLVQALTVVGCP
jgi:HYR domain